MTMSNASTASASNCSAFFRRVTVTPRSRQNGKSICGPTSSSRDPARLLARVMLEPRWSLIWLSSVRVRYLSGSIGFSYRDCRKSGTILRSVVACNYTRSADKEENLSRLRQHVENHLIDRIGWLRAAVLGANDGIISTASLIVGVAAAATTQNEVLIAGV